MASLEPVAHQAAVNYRAGISESRRRAKRKTAQQGTRPHIIVASLHWSRHATSKDRGPTFPTQKSEGASDRCGAGFPRWRSPVACVDTLPETRRGGQSNVSNSGDDDWQQRAALPPTSNPRRPQSTCRHRRHSVWSHGTSLAILFSRRGMEDRGLCPCTPTAALRLRQERCKLHIERP